MESENITLEMEELGSGIAQYFEENIPDDALAVSYKFNINTEEELTFENSMSIRKIIDYMKSFTTVLAFTHGIHEEGKADKPHIHIHFYITPCEAWNKSKSNRSQHRNRWFDKECLSRIDGISVKEAKIQEGTPKFHFLSYPLKEGKYLKFKKISFELEGETMTKEFREFLLQYGQQLFQIKLGKDLANDKADERKEIKYSEILSIARNFTGGSYRDFQIYMEVNYIEKLYLERNIHIPDISNYKKNLQRAGVELRYFKSYEI